VLLATAACAPAPGSPLPVAAPVELALAPKAQPSVTYRFEGPGLGQSHGMPVIVPDATRLERMPVFRPDTMIDRAMVVRGYGRTFTLRGPANPSSDSVQRAAPRP